MSKEKKSKKTKNNDSLKKNKSSYMFFCIEERSNIKIEKPDLNNKEIVVELGSRWNELKQNNQERFKYYDNLAVKDKERYLKEKNSVSENKVSTPPLKEETNVEKKSKKTKKNVKKSEPETVPEPETHSTEKIEEISKNVTEEKQKKTRVNSYINFCKKMRDVIKTKNSNFTAKDIQQELSNLWKKLSDAEKEEYKH